MLCPLCNSSKCIHIHSIRQRQSRVVSNEHTRWLHTNSWQWAVTGFGTYSLVKIIMCSHSEESIAQLVGQKTQDQSSWVRVQIPSYISNLMWNLVEMGFHVICWWSSVNGELRGNCDHTKRAFLWLPLSKKLNLVEWGRFQWSGG